MDNNLMRVVLLLIPVLDIPLQTHQPFVHLPIKLIAGAQALEFVFQSFAVIERQNLW